MIKTSIVFRPEILEWVDKQAKANDRSRSYMINELLQQIIELLNEGNTNE